MRESTSVLLLVFFFFFLLVGVAHVLMYLWIVSLCVAVVRMPLTGVSARVWVRVVVCVVWVGVCVGVRKTEGGWMSDGCLLRKKTTNVACVKSVVWEVCVCVCVQNVSLWINSSICEVRVRCVDYCV